MLQSLPPERLTLTGVLSLVMAQVSVKLKVVKSGNGRPLPSPFWGRSWIHSADLVQMERPRLVVSVLVSVLPVVRFSQ